MTNNQMEIDYVTYLLKKDAILWQSGRQFQVSSTSHERELNAVEENFYRPRM